MTSYTGPESGYMKPASRYMHFGEYRQGIYHGGDIPRYRRSGYR